MYDFQRDFLLKISKVYALTPEQTKVFLLRFGESASYENIQKRLKISKEAAIQRMSLIYKKFDIKGATRGKEALLQELLSNLAKEEIDLLRNGSSISSEYYFETTDLSKSSYQTLHSVETSVENPLPHLDKLCQELQNQSLNSVPLALKELSNILPYLARWIALNSHYRELDITITFISYFKFLCLYFNFNELEIQDDIKDLNSKYITSYLVFLTEYKEKIEDEIEIEKHNLVKKISGFLKSFINELNHIIEKDFLKYIQSQKELLTRIEKKEMYIETLISNLTNYIAEKISVVKNEIEIEEHFLIYSKKIKKLLSHYQLLRAKINININNIPLQQLNLLNYQLKFESELQEKIPSTIIELIALKTELEILSPVKKAFINIYSKEENIKQKSKTVKILKDELINNLEKLSNEHEKKIQDIVENVFNKYQQDIIELINKDIDFLKNIIGN